MLWRKLTYEILFFLQKKPQKSGLSPAAAASPGTQFSCFTSTKVQILTQKLGPGERACHLLY